MDKFLEKDDFVNYKIIFVPFSPYISSKAAEKLKDYVKRGGVLIAEGSTAQYDDSLGAAAMVPAYGLDEVFGNTVGEDQFVGFLE